jgi:hypothetical protein
VNRKQRRGGGWRRPPHEGLIGRTDVARILQCDRSTTFRWEKDLILKAAFTEADGTRWFAREAVMQLAALMRKNGRRKGGADRKNGRGRQVVAAAPAPPQAKEKVYDPSTPVYDPALRSRLTPGDETPKAPVKPAPPAPQQPSAAKGRKAPPRPLPQGDPRWFDEDWKPPTPPARDDDDPKPED